MLTLEKLKTVCPNITQEILDSINKTCEKYKINSKERYAHFVGQMAHESGGFFACSENLNYSAEGLLKVFSKYFNSGNVAAYAKKPELIASKVYASRMGNGDESSKDGWKYRGRGFIQITGKDNYTEFGKDQGQDFVSNPDLVSKAPYNVLSAGWFWNKAGCNYLADKLDIIGVTKKINGGTNGLDDRRALTNKLLSLF